LRETLLQRWTLGQHEENVDLKVGTKKPQQAAALQNSSCRHFGSCRNIGSH
jgi:hypothetical protein